MKQKTKGFILKLSSARRVATRSKRELYRPLPRLAYRGTVANLQKTFSREFNLQLVRSSRSDIQLPIPGLGRSLLGEIEIQAFNHLLVFALGQLRAGKYRPEEVHAAFKSAMETIDTPVLERHRGCIADQLAFLELVLSQTYISHG